MYDFKLFTKRRFNNRRFQDTLKKAIQVIKSNKTGIAEKVFEVIIAKKVQIRSFYQLPNKMHFLKMRLCIKPEWLKQAPTTYPPQDFVLRFMENSIDGAYFNGYIYLDSRLSPTQMAEVLVHEITHYINKDLAASEQETKSKTLALYRDEIRAHIGEWIFKKNGSPLLRTDVKKIHREVRAFYPEFDEPGIKKQKLGLIEPFSL